MKPKIKATSFGSITVGKETFHHDVVIELDGAVRKRRKKLSKQLFGTSHKVSLEEIQDVYEKGGKLLIVGTGQYDNVRLSKEAQAYLAEQGCEAILLSTPEALEKWNETEREGETIGLFHVTC
jgi:hypothetical protein